MLLAERTLGIPDVQLTVFGRNVLHGNFVRGGHGKCIFRCGLHFNFGSDARLIYENLYNRIINILVQ